LPTGADLADARAFFAHAVLPLMSQLRGRPCFHGSGVALGERAVGFLGRSGSGKSTLAASFGARARVLGDDTFVVEVDGDRAFARPSESQVRLWEDSVARFAEGRRTDVVLGKFEIACEPASDRVELARLYLPTMGAPAVEIEPLRARDALVALAANCQRLDPTDPRLLEQEIAYFETIAARVVVARLHYPRDFDRVGEVHDAIARDVGGP
jgi:hypothetical protein